MDPPAQSSDSNQAAAPADQVIDTTKAGAPSADPPAEDAAAATDGTPGTAPLPPTPVPPQAVIEPKKSGSKSLVKKILPIIFLVALVGIASFAGYFYGQASKKNNPIPSANTTIENPVALAQAESSQSANPSNTPIPAPTCISGYKPFTSKGFSICYPSTMIHREDKTASSGAQPTDQIIFEDEVETLRIETNFEENLNKYDCVSSKVVKVSGFQAQRYLMKDKSKTGTSCATTINAYATIVSAGNDQPVYYIGLTKKSGSYQSDNGEFAAIEGSFKINQ
jgi:hypothetical protein